MMNHLKRVRTLVRAALPILAATVVTAPLHADTPRVQAAGITVNSLGDGGSGDGQCTLREAITNANADAAPEADCATGAGADAISFSLSGTITLASNLPVLTDPAGLTIDGEGQSVVVSGAGLFHVFRISEGASFIVNRLTIVGGKAVEGGNGGAVLNMGTTALNRTTIEGNTTAGFTGVGGGIFNAGSMTITASAVLGNTAITTGGGGGVYNQGTLTLANTTISGNQARRGGGILNAGPLTIINSTITENRASDGGGGVSNDAGPADLVISNTIISGNAAPVPRPDCSGPIEAVGTNLVGVTVGCTITGAPPIEGDAKLGALGEYGGRTRTHPVQPGSPSIDVGDPLVCASTPVGGVDQRGVIRPQGTQCDLGAFERRPGELIGINGDFEAGGSGWTFTGSVDADGSPGIARVETEGACFGANNTKAIAFNGNRALNVRSNPGGRLESTGIATSAPFVLGAALQFRALSENDDAVPELDPVSFEVRILDGSGGVRTAHDVKTNVLTTSPGTTTNGCLVGDQRDGPWSTHTIDTSVDSGLVGQVEFRQHTNLFGKGFFTLIDDVVVVP